VIFINRVFKSVTERERGDVTEKWRTFHVNEECFLKPHRIVRTVGQVHLFFSFYTNKRTTSYVY
jgi:hypothetical protein